MWLTSRKVNGEVVVSKECLLLRRELLCHCCQAPKELCCVLLLHDGDDLSVDAPEVCRLGEAEGGILPPERRVACNGLCLMDVKVLETLEAAETVELPQRVQVCVAEGHCGEGLHALCNAGEVLRNVLKKHKAERNTTHR